MAFFHPLTTEKFQTHSSLIWCDMIWRWREVVWYVPAWYHVITLQKGSIWDQPFRFQRKGHQKASCQFVKRLSFHSDGWDGERFDVTILPGGRIKCPKYRLRRGLNAVEITISFPPRMLVHSWTIYSVLVTPAYFRAHRWLNWWQWIDENNCPNIHNKRIVREAQSLKYGVLTLIIRRQEQVLLCFCCVTKHRNK